jgi:hypothetical protein
MTHLRQWASRLCSAAIVTTWLSFAPSASAYPEFQRSIQTASGRVVSCGMCHVNPEGPDGVKHGQIGNLGDGERATLNRSRNMFEPGPLVDSPILNSFGDYLVSHLGRTRLMAFKEDPAKLNAALDPRRDLDADGIPDERELRDGTDPTDPRHGDPGLLFLHNLKHHWFHVLMLSIATLFGLFGLSRLFHWFAHESQRAIAEKDGRRKLANGGR